MIMSNDRLTRVRMVTTPRKGLMIPFASGAFTSATTYATGNPLECGIAFDALGVNIKTFLQGYDLYTDPFHFGGIASDNSATGGPQVIGGQYGVTTVMPGTYRPLVDHIIVEGPSGVGFGILRIKRFVDEAEGVICEDPTGYWQFQGSVQATTMSSWYRAPVRVKITQEAGIPFWIGYAGDSQTTGDNVPSVVSIGDGVNPVMPFIATSGNDSLLTIIEY